MPTDIEKALGLPTTVTGFLDGVDRNFYPFKMKEAQIFFKTLFDVRDFKRLMINMLFEDSTHSLTDLFALCFRDNPIEDLEEVINIQNFEFIMRQIFDCSGLEFPKDEEKSDENPQIGV